MRNKVVNPLILAASLMMLVCTKPAPGQDAPANPPAKTVVPDKGPPTILRAYDVQDLLVIVKNYPASGPLLPPTKVREAPASSGGGGGGGQNGALFGTPPASPAPIDQLRRLIIDAIDQSSWKDNGGNDGSISALNGQLFITQTEANQAAIANLLDELRKGRAHTIRVRADWVLLAPGELDKLLKNGAGDTAALPEVSRDVLQHLPTDMIHYAGQIACFSGQTVHIASGRARHVITGNTPVVAPGAVAMDPTVDYVHYGISLEINATVSKDSATLDLCSIVSDAGKTPAAPSTQPAALSIDRLNNVIQNFHTTVQVPLNKPVLVGGTTADPSVDEPGGKELYLVIEANTGK